MDELKITKGGEWSKLLSAFVTRKLKKHGVNVTVNSVEGESSDGTTKLHIDANLSLTTAQVVKILIS